MPREIKGAPAARYRNHAASILAESSPNSENQSDCVIVSLSKLGVEAGLTVRYIWPWIVALAIEHEAKPPLKLSEAKGNSTDAGTVRITRKDSIALEQFKVFTCTHQLFSCESTAVQQAIASSIATCCKYCNK